MISCKINDIPKFMSLLFSSESFDSFYLSEAVIRTFSTFTIDGHTNVEFYDDTVEFEKYATWASLRPLCRELIKGKRIPVSMRFSFLISDKTKNELLEESGYPGTYEGIHFIFNIIFEGNDLKIISATSTNTFMFDKSYEKVWDDGFRVMLTKLNLSFEES